MSRENSLRDEKMMGQIKELAARFFSLESNRTSLITVTSVSLSDNGKEATVFFTVFPEDKEDAVLYIHDQASSTLIDGVQNNREVITIDKNIEYSRSD